MTETFAKTVAVFLLLVLTVGINLSEQILMLFNLDQELLLLALSAIAIAGLVVNQNLLVIVLVVALSVAINMPPAFLAEYSLNQETLFATLLTVVLAPIVIKLAGVNLNTR